MPTSVLIINGRGNTIDGILPLGLIQAVNLLEVPKRGVFYFQLTPELVRDVQVVVMHLHWDFNYIFFAEIVGFVRQHNPQAQIVVGGYISTVHSTRLLRDLPIDYCLIRDPEFAFKWLIDAIIAGRTPEWIQEHVPNVVSRVGESKSTHKPSREDLGRLDSFDLSWFPMLETYLWFQDALGVIGPRRFRTEEQYFPGVILKGSFDRSCKFCAFGNQNFKGFCEPDRYTYLREEDFVAILDRCQRAGFHMLNVFGDFAFLSIERILQLCGDRRFSFELTIGDYFKKIEPELLIEFGSRFPSLTFLFRTLPPTHFVGSLVVTPDALDRAQDEELLRKIAAHPNLSVGFWVNGKNLSPGFEEDVYGDKLKHMDSWLPFPTQKPNDLSYGKLNGLARERVAGILGRQVRAAWRPMDAMELDQTTSARLPTPFTQTVDADQIADLEKGLSFALLPVDELGVFHAEKRLSLSDHTSGLELLLLDKKPGRACEFRRFQILLPTPVAEVTCALRYGDHLGTISIGSQSTLLISTAEDLHGYTSAEERAEIHKRWLSRELSDRDGPGQIPASSNSAAASPTTP